MSGDPTWLETLQQATTYQQLQAVFDQMESAVVSSGVDPNIVDQIDEAIRRIEQERTRDQAELAEFNEQYSAFKDQHSGVVGWFKRKMPFTSTRKQDGELRESVRDQEAEILADNFVIARAQMLKETLLPPGSNRMGYAANQSRQRLAASDSVSSLREFGQVVWELHGENSKAADFVAAIKADIDAFAAAKFAEKEDARLQKESLDKARQQLDRFVGVIDEKKKLVAAAEDRLRHLLEQDLAEQDPSFRSLQQHASQLDSFVKQGDQAGRTLDARHQLLDKLQEKLDNFSGLPVKVKTLQDQLDKLQSEFRHIEGALRQAESAAEPVSQRYEAARQAADQAKLRVETARPLVEAYLAEQGLDLSAVSDHASTSSICAEYESLRAAASAGQAQLQGLASEFESAKRLLKEKQAELDKRNRTAQDHQQQLSKLNQDAATLQGELAALCDQYRLGKLTFQSSLESWLNERAQLQWHPQLSQVQLLPTELLEEILLAQLIQSPIAPGGIFPPTSFPAQVPRHGQSPLKRIQESLTRFTSQFRQAQSTAQALLKQLSQERTSALQSRAQLLLDGELAARLFSHSA